MIALHQINQIQHPHKCHLYDKQRERKRERERDRGREEERETDKGREEEREKRVEEPLERRGMHPSVRKERRKRSKREVDITSRRVIKKKTTYPVDS